MKKVTKSAKETKQLARKLAGQLKGGEVLALSGELGSGKTTFVQGLAEYFNTKEHASSPTFTLINEYLAVNSKSEIRNSKQIRNPKSEIKKIIHADCYRLKDVRELLEIGFHDYLDSGSSVVVIEWAEKVKDILPTETSWIYFKHSDKESERVIEIRV